MPEVPDIHGWLPIATVPMNGVLVDLWMTEIIGGDQRIPGCRWVPNFWRGWDEVALKHITAGAWLQDRWPTGKEPIIGRPTHWRRPPPVLEFSTKG